ncbi:uncharacterized protein [Amphiura filiformis]|uniref:uncharacterized protein n=1 Tax=Amphiura filiformis TaxID=82378 RepID=UPI003B21E803
MTCLVPSTNDQTMIESVFLEWNAPVQIEPGGILRRFLVHLLDNDNSIVASADYSLSEDEKAAVLSSNAEVSFQAIVSTFVTLSRHVNYTLQIRTRVYNVSETPGYVVDEYGKGTPLDAIGPMAEVTINTREVSECSFNAIQVASAPVNPRMTCLVPSINDQTMIESAFVEWNAPVQTEPGWMLRRYLVHLLDNDNSIVASADDYVLSEDQKAAVHFSNVEVLFKAIVSTSNPISRNANYNLHIQTRFYNVSETPVYIVGEDGNKTPFDAIGPRADVTINTRKVPVCSPNGKMK